MACLVGGGGRRTANTPYAPLMARRRDATSFKSAWTTSTPFAASFFALSLPLSLVRARIWKLSLATGSLRMLVTTEPPCFPVAPITTIVCLVIFHAAVLCRSATDGILGRWKLGIEECQPRVVEVYVLGTHSRTAKYSTRWVTL